MESNGLWVAYNDVNDYIKLYDSVKNVDAYWKVNDLNNAEYYLTSNNVHIYYTRDSDGSYSIPRICIVVSKANRVSFAWGIAQGENIEPELLDVIDKKLDEINDKKYLHKQRTSDMKLLSFIQAKTQREEELSVEEIKFLYEFDREIKCFGFSKDSRIGELRKIRDAAKDMNKVFRSMDNYEGDLIFDFPSYADGLEFPRIIKGNFVLNKVSTLKNCKLPEYVEGGIYFPKLKKLKNVIFTEKVLGDVSLESLKQADYVIFPEYIGGSFDAGQLETTKSVVFPRVVHNDSNLNSWHSFEKTIFSEQIGGTIYLLGLNNIEGLIGLKDYGIKMYTSLGLLNFDFKLNREYPISQCNDIKNETNKQLLKKMK